VCPGSMALERRVKKRRCLSKVRAGSAKLNAMRGLRVNQGARIAWIAALVMVVQLTARSNERRMKLPVSFYARDRGQREQHGDCADCH